MGQNLLPGSVIAVMHACSSVMHSIPAKTFPYFHFIVMNNRLP